MSTTLHKMGAALAAALLSLTLVACATGHETLSHDPYGQQTSQSQPAPKPDKPTPTLTVSQQEAVDSAEMYLEAGGFSKAGLVDQLSSKYGEGFPKADAVFAVNHVKVDWNHEAVECAQNYLDMGGFSHAGLVDQLSSPYGDQFTHAQAEYAATHVGL